MAERPKKIIEIRSERDYHRVCEAIDALEAYREGTRSFGPDDELTRLTRLKLDWEQGKTSAHAIANLEAMFKKPQ